MQMRKVVVLGLLLTMFVVLNIVIIKYQLKDAVPVVVMVLNIVKSLIVLPVDLVIVDMIFMKSQMNFITQDPLISV
jgi:hypothetical protein